MVTRVLDSKVVTIGSLKRPQKCGDADTCQLQLVDLESLCLAFMQMAKPTWVPTPESSILSLIYIGNMSNIYVSVELGN